MPIGSSPHNKAREFRFFGRRRNQGFHNISTYQDMLIFPLESDYAFRYCHTCTMHTTGQKIQALQRLLRERIVLIDGAMGTMVHQQHLDETAYRGERFKNWPKDLTGLHDVLCLTQPGAIEAIHHQYLEAGADIIETNTFNAQAISLTDYGLQSLAYEINVAAAQCARRAADAVMQ